MTEPGSELERLRRDGLPPPLNAAEVADPEILVPLTLVPVEVFGAHCACHDQAEIEGGVCTERGYGLSDAVSAWSDCNRAEGRIYRIDDTDPAHRLSGDTVRVWVSRADLPWFEKRFGERQHEEAP